MVTVTYFYTYMNVVTRKGNVYCLPNYLIDIKRNYYRSCYKNNQYDDKMQQ